MLDHDIGNNMETWTNTTKHNSTFTNKSFAGLAQWGDPIATWGDSNYAWGDGRAIWSDSSKHSSTFVNQVKN